MNSNLFPKRCLEDETFQMINKFNTIIKKNQSSQYQTDNTAWKMQKVIEAN